MISVKCPNCGEFVAIDETVETEKKCPHCDLLIKLTKDNAEYAEILGRSDKLREKCAKAVEEYKNSTDANGAKSIIPLLGAYSDFKTLPDFFKIWRDFILAVAAEAVAKKDNELQSLLKNHAKRFDDESKGGDSLYLFLLMSNAKVGNNTDWDILIEKTCGDGVKFSSLVHSIKDYVVANKNKAFAIYVFNFLSSKEEEAKREVKTYLSTILDDDAVAENVFPRRAFGGKTKKFIRKASVYCKKFCSEYVVEETKVWANYVAACKVQKRRNLGIAVGTLAVVAGAAIGVACYLNATDKSTISINIDSYITHVYGEAIPLDGYTVTYKKNSGAEVTKPITEKMLSGYDSQTVGPTQTVFVEYGGESRGVTVRIEPAKLATPVVTQSGGNITWEVVANAAEYGIYIGSDMAITTTTESLFYDLSAYGSYGNLEIRVSAIPDDSGKYVSSDLSETKRVTKLQAPQNVRYEDGILFWDEVTDATKYEITVNGVDRESTTNYLQADLAQGDNTIRIVATTTATGVVNGVTETTVYYLDKASGFSYAGNVISWEAGEKSTSYDIYVDGEFVKNIVAEKSFDVTADGFADKLTDGVHKIGIVCRSAVGTAPSARAEFSVDVGNHITVSDSAMQWNAVQGAVNYTVSVNGVSLQPRTATYLVFGEVTDWAEGNVNTVTVTANDGANTVLCETVKVIKLARPQVSVSGGNWVTDNNADNRFSLDNGEWSTSLPEIGALSVGEHTVRVRRVRSGEGALEIESDIVEIKINKPVTPVIAVSYGVATSSVRFDGDKYELQLYSSTVADGEYNPISSLADIKVSGTYYIKAGIVGKDGAETGYDWIVPSDLSATPAEVIKLEAPEVYYTEGAARVTSNNAHAKFYYTVREGDKEVEAELVDGLVSNLPKGSFSIYARVPATAANELASENTPDEGGKRVQISNLNITLSASKISTGAGKRFNVYFNGCEGIDVINFTYDVVHYDRDGNKLGEINVRDPATFTKEVADSTEISGRLDFYTGADFDDRQTYRITLIVYLSIGSEAQILSCEVNA